LESSEPVGSSARITGRIVGERARDRDALALAAGQLVRPLVHVLGKPERGQQARSRARASHPAIARRARASAA
jgi:hypothetical protein